VRALGIDIYLYGNTDILSLKGKLTEVLQQSKMTRGCFGNTNAFLKNARSRYSWIVCLPSSFHWHRNRRPWSHKLAECSGSWWGHDKQGSRDSVHSLDTIAVLFCDSMQEDTKPFQLF